ncbi:MAG TPA: hypothetical protein VIX90_07850, partial [Edaphobacter sp.]
MVVASLRESWSHLINVGRFLSLGRPLDGLPDIKWTKAIPSFFGGTRNGMVISWPAKITDKGGIRNQFQGSS